ncbi:pirin family protein [Fulvivirga ulvae]|uniref:pirin family protein n=1 Tax=Fulvivirga ulvae TaxID=2904245 RepID=UPI001F263AF4|nr:pirin family protein [Fulvivirga ulvae]UII31698.1 pirin family protein [Fulvivirga ulvae]
MRTVSKIHNAEYRPIADLKTYSPLPTRQLSQIDPFLFLNHHGPQTYPPDNQGLPFGPHPHRGMQTVTFIMEGDIMHQDSGGHESIISAGGVQWMVAGSGLIHAEISSDAFKKEGGPLEILQLWLNLPASLKMTEPHYTGLQKQDIPTQTLSDGKVAMNLISGDWNGTQSAFTPQTDVHLTTIHFMPGGELDLQIPLDQNIFFYVIKGQLEVNDHVVKATQLAEFNNDHEDLKIVSSAKSTLLLGYARPFNEPVVAQGPFVMNTEQEIYEAYDDYRKGKFGSWNG